MMDIRAWLIVGITLLLGSGARGERFIYTPSTETAALRANLIVEGTLEQQWLEKPRSFGDSGIWSFKVSHVIAGPYARSKAEVLASREDGAAPLQSSSQPAPVNVGDVIVIDGINRHSVTDDLLANEKTRRLSAGDKLMLFLVIPDRFEIARPIAGAPRAQWMVPDMGLRYVAGDMTYPFVQYWGAEHMLMTSVFVTKTNAISKGFRPAQVALIRERATTAIRDAESIQAKIAAATVQDVPWLKEMVQAGEDPKPGEASASHWWAGRAAERLRQIAASAKPPKSP